MDQHRINQLFFESLGNFSSENAKLFLVPASHVFRLDVIFFICMIVN